MVIEGDRIYLSPLTAADATEQYLGWLHDPGITWYLEVRHSPPADLWELRDYIEFESRRLLLAIVLKDSDQHIGNIKLGYDGDVGLLIGERDEWSKGYGSEAIRLLTQYAFSELGLAYLWAGVHVANIGSGKAFLKAGWVQEEWAPKKIFVARRMQWRDRK